MFNRKASNLVLEVSFDKSSFMIIAMSSEWKIIGEEDGP